MGTTRKRKVETVEPKNLSAVARRRLQNQAKLSISDTASVVTSRFDDNLLFSTESLKEAERATAINSIRSGTSTPADRPVLSRKKSVKSEDDSLSESECEEDVEREVETNYDGTTFIPQVPQAGAQFTFLNRPIEREQDGSVLITVAGAGERLVVAGEFGLRVIQGTITILGARLVASDVTHKIYAFLSHSLPVIRCSSSDCNLAVIRLEQLSSGIARLGDLSPLFKDLGVDDNKDMIGEDMIGNAMPTSFQVLFSKTTAQSKKLKWPIVSPSEWNKCLDTSSTRRSAGENKIIMLCGPKSSGKSTFSTLLTNRFLTEPGGRKPGVAFLDLDPGQPEYSLSGQLTLMHIKEPNFAPPFCHVGSSQSANRVVHSHFVGTITPSGDSDHYKSCLLDLIKRYHQFRRTTSCPLIINTPGWVQGTGLELLVGLIKKACPTDIIYMSEEGPRDVVETLKRAAAKIPFITLPSQAKDYMTRTAANLRTMQTMSYFHQSGGASQWSPVPLTSISPMEVDYAGPNQGIVGIMCLGEQPPADLLKDTIDGNLVAIVSLRDEQKEALSFSKPHIDTAPCIEEDFISFSAQDEDDAPTSVSPINSQHNTIIRTPEQLPYLESEDGALLTPGEMNCLGMALIRGIDTTRRKLQLLTPLNSSTIRNLIKNGSRIILISGKLDTPGWAYTEEINRQDAIRRQRSEIDISDQKTSTASTAIDTTTKTAFERAPWIEKLSGDGGRGVENRTWRVRRDLGRGA